MGLMRKWAALGTATAAARLGEHVPEPTSGRIADQARCSHLSGERLIRPLLRHLPGCQKPLRRIEVPGETRDTVSQWVNSGVDLRQPEFDQTVQALSRRGCDL